jgi:hypothetical protein
MCIRTIKLRKGMAEIRTHCQSVGATENWMKISKKLAKLVESLEKQQFKKEFPILCLKKRQIKFVGEKKTLPTFPISQMLENPKEF